MAHFALGMLACGEKSAMALPSAPAPPRNLSLALCSPRLRAPSSSPLVKDGDNDSHLGAPGLEETWLNCFSFAETASPLISNTFPLLQSKWGPHGGLARARQGRE